VFGGEAIGEGDQVFDRWVYYDCAVAGQGFFDGWGAVQLGGLSFEFFDYRSG